MTSIGERPTTSERQVRRKKQLVWLRFATLVTAGILIMRVFALAQDNYNGILLFGSRQHAGNVKPGKEVHCEVMALNLGLRPVSISSVPHCGCTVEGDYDHTMMPLGLISVPIAISTDGVKKGPHTRRLELRFKSGKTSWHRDATIQFSLTK